MNDKVVTVCDHLKNLMFSPVTPHVFTEHGAIMVASVLNSPRAICRITPRFLVRQCISLPVMNSGGYLNNSDAFMERFV